MAEPECWSLADIKARGWTAGLIKRLLGAPDKLASNPYRRSGPPAQLYRRERVLLAEATPEYRDAQAALAGRRAKTKARTRARHAEQVQWAATIDIQRSAGFSKPLAAHRQAALRARIDRDGELGRFGSDPSHAEEQHVARWTLNHVRHTCTDYDELAAKVPRTVNREAYEVLRRRVNEMIVDRYPELRVALALD